MEETRILLLSNSINNISVSEIIQRIWDINREDAILESTHVGYEREPINLIINSEGGSIDDGLALIGAIEMSKTPITTVGLGKVMSMALAIFASGHTRITHRFTMFMYHEVMTISEGTLQEYKRKLKELEKIQAVYDNIVINNSTLSQEKLDEVCQSGEDWFFSADEALEFSLADYIYDAAQDEKGQISFQFISLKERQSQKESV